jgi:hypothetical protein
VKRIQSEPGNYLTFYDNIFEVIRNNGKLKVTPQEALMNIHAIELAIQSSKERKTLPFDKNLLEA